MTLLDGLVAHWKLDEESGTRYDSVGNNNYIEFDPDDAGEHVPFAQGKLATCAKFTDSIIGNGNPYLESGLPFTSMSQMGCTYSGWFKVNTWATIDAVHLAQIFQIFSSGDTCLAVAAGSILDNDFGNTPSIVFYDSNSPNPNNVAKLLPIDEFAFVVAWYDRVLNTLNIQLNGGNIVSHGAGTLFNYIIASGSMGIGWFENNDDQLLVDSFSIWNRVLTPEERSALYNSGAGLDYPFEQQGVSDLLGYALDDYELEDWVSDYGLN